MLWYRPLPAGLSAATAALVAACAPSLDWREIRPEGSAVVATFPCRPGRHERELPLAGQQVRLTLLTCTAGDMQFGLSFLDVAQAEQIGPALDALRLSVAANLAGAPATAVPLVVPGMTPNPQASTMHVSGHRPNGQVAQAMVAVFSSGPQVFQAQVIGAALDPAAAQAFIAGLRVAVR